MTRPTRPYNLTGIDVIHWYRDHKAIIDSDCWLYQHPENFNGWDNEAAVRPRVMYQSKTYLISRLAYQLSTNQEIPKEMQIGHTCEATSPDHRLCFNPDHLALVTTEENSNMKRISGCEEYAKLKSKLAKEVYAAGKVMPRFTNHLDRIDWILKNTTEENANGCLVCNQGLEDGYARRNFSFFDSVIDGQSPSSTKDGRKKVFLHRYIKFVLEGIDYTKAKRSIVVHHTCANKSCLNPDHLEITTQSKNIKAAITYHSQTKLNETIVYQIYTHWIRDKDNYTYRQDFLKKYAEKFGVALPTIDKILRKRCWVDVTDAIDQEYSMGIKKIS